MTVKQLKNILQMLDDDSIVKILITDEEYNEAIVDVTNYNADGDYVVFEGEV